VQRLPLVQSDLSTLRQRENPRDRLLKEVPLLLQGGSLRIGKDKKKKGKRRPRRGTRAKSASQMSGGKGIGRRLFRKEIRQGGGGGPPEKELGRRGGLRSNEKPLPTRNSKKR